MLRCHGLVDMSLVCESHGLWLESHRDTNVLWQDINLQLPFSTQVLNGYMVGCEHHYHWINMCVLVKMA